jgi:CubicO group peptidase (beta-lactamase class C family)
MRKYVFFLLIAAFYMGNNAFAQVITPAQIDSLVAKTMKTFDVPGIAVAIIKDDKVIHSKGYGVRSLNSPQKVDENTLFGIASNSKAFTSAALAILVDEGKMSWDDKVIDHLPEFRMYDPYVTHSFTIKDLLTHRSGLGLGAGDLMFFPDSADFTRKDIIHNLRYLKQTSEFRTKFDYDNCLYVVAGEVIAKVSGLSWEEFIETRILQPLGMSKTAATFSRLKDKSNVIDAHAPVNGKVQVIRRDFNETANAAGGIYSSIADMSKWVRLQLSEGKFGDKKEKQLFSAGQHAEMWMPQTILRTRGGGPYNTHFAAYGLGWFMGDEKGYKQVSHTGGLAGIVTQVTMIPDLKIGIIVLTNQQSGEAFSAITNTIKDSYYGVKGIDRIKQQYDRMMAGRENAKTIMGDPWQLIEEQRKKITSIDTSSYLGTYKDVWFGEVTISKKNGKLWFDSKRSPRLSGEMFLYRTSTFVVKWNDRSMDADAFAMFKFDESGKASGFSMKPVSPLTDFSYDFQDLDFSRQ